MLRPSRTTGVKRSSPGLRDAAHAAVQAGPLKAWWRGPRPHRRAQSATTSAGQLDPLRTASASPFSDPAPFPDSNSLPPGERRSRPALAFQIANCGADRASDECCTVPKDIDSERLDNLRRDRRNWQEYCQFRECGHSPLPGRTSDSRCQEQNRRKAATQSHGATASDRQASRAASETHRTLVRARRAVRISLKEIPS